MNILEIKNLVVSVRDTGEDIVRRVELTVPEQSVVALVGGSGSGKSTTGFSILGLLAPALAVMAGEINFKGENILHYSQEHMQKLRGGRIGMVFQEPLNAFNPVFTISSQIDEVLRYHTDLTGPQRKNRILELMDLVGMPDVQRIARSYPHQLSGGLRQRAMIAQAIAAEPELIIADEPTSNLDVTLQAHIMDLFKQLKSKLKLSILLISHDLGMVEHLADEVVVLKKGQVVETGSVEKVMEFPRHDYTRALMSATR